ncbi:FtsH protease activity modulator HflK [Granulosicoccaceae sp. 1_MG-2023]|nr:FtsH protease activity modulator HflK [Granulosicoccaceae sp. 1_MG-2023]
MAWNEPGGSNDQDPWGNRKNNGSGGPPDLDEVFKNLQNKFGGLFGRRGGGSSGGSGGAGNIGPRGFLIIGAVIAVFWLASGIYIIQPAERGVVTRFGKFSETTGPGPHWHWPWPVAALERVNVDQIRSVRLRSQPMLTKDENIVEIDMSVQYNISDAAKYLFNVRSPDLTLEEVAESAIREVIGQNNMDPIITQGRSAIAQSTLENMQEIMENYGTGILVTTVNLESAQPPEAVQAAFSDAIKAREDEQRYINESEAYANEVVPRARGDARRILEQAKAYRTEVVKAAEGESARFLALLNEYKKAPEVTRDRLYIQSLENVLQNSSKILLDGGEGSNNLMYLPLDKLMQQGGTGTSSFSGTTIMPSEDTFSSSPESFQQSPGTSRTSTPLSGSRSRSRETQ